MSRAAAAVVGSVRLRRTRWRDVRCRLLDLELDAEVADVRRRLEATTRQKHLHDLANAFTAAEGAATILRHDSLSVSDRSMLSEKLGSGLARVRALLSADPADEQVMLTEVVTSLADDPCWRDRVRLDVAPDLVVAGSAGEIAESIRRMLVHAGGRAPMMPVTLRAGRTGDRTEVWVEDRGPRLSAPDRRRILEPGRRRPPRRTTVDELQVACRLARGQGADLRVEPRLGGGESFGISWVAPQ